MKLKLSDYDLDAIRQEYPATYEYQLGKIKKAIDKRLRRKEREDRKND